MQSADLLAGKEAKELQIRLSSSSALELLIAMMA
jgi:hypothetical protein